MLFGLKATIIILSILVLVGTSVNFRVENGEAKFIGIRPWGAAPGVILVVVAIYLSLAIGQIDSGFRGVVLRYGAVTGKVMGEGIYFLTPKIETVERMDVQIHKYETPIASGSKDLQEVDTTVTLNYRINPEKADEVYRTLRRDYVDRVITPAVFESVKATMARFDAEELIVQRAAVESGIEETLREALTDNGIIVDGVKITAFLFSNAFQSAIEAKQVAVQRAFEAENKLVQVRVESQQAEAQAQGRRDSSIKEAEGRRASAILDAEGQAEAILKVAEAQAKANDLINSTLSEQVIQYSLVTELADDIRVIVLPAGQQFILGEGVFGGSE